MSKADDLTEQSLHGLERKIKSEYSKASDDLSAMYQAYIGGWDEEKDGKKIHHKGLDERFLEEEKKYLAGDYTKEQWTQWKLTQMARGERYQEMCDQMAVRMTEANKVAAAYINDRTPGIYSLNQNYEAYNIGKGLQGVSFDLYDEQTIKNLMNENSNNVEFRTVSVNPSRDYAWNKQQIQSAMTSGILEGKSIDQIADNFMGVMGRNRSAAVRNARTAYTSAQNCGRLESMRQSKEMGLNVQKRWLATKDQRTRDSHEILDGQIRDIEEPFDNDLMYPGDPDGEPSEVYNCRCTMTYIYPKFFERDSSEIYRDNSLEGESFKDFVERMKDERRNSGN